VVHRSKLKNRKKAVSLDASLLATHRCVLCHPDTKLGDECNHFQTAPF
jgi:hypothetical protein